MMLTRTQPEKNMHRFYALNVAPTLFGEWMLISEWGRIGSPGTVRLHSYPTLTDAHNALEERLRRKTARGYRVAA